MRFVIYIMFACSLMVMTGCETVHEASRQTGRVAGEVANVPGNITEGAAESIQGRTTSEENPYGR